MPAAVPSRPLTEILADAVKSALASGELDHKRLLQSVDGAPMTGLFGQVSDEAQVETDPTLCSVFAPPVVEQHTPFDIQVMLHSAADLLEAASTAMREDPKARRRAYAPLKINLASGQQVKFYLDSADLIVAAPITSTTWYGFRNAAKFRAEIAPHVKKDTVEGVVHVYLGEIPIGAINFDLAVKPAERLTRSAPSVQPVSLANTMASGFVPATSRSNRYGRAFLSYARKDVAYASIFAEGLHNSGIDLFVDITALEPGDDWKAKLIEAIQNCDVFYLLWSSNAATSEWVKRECAEACKRLQSGRSMPFNIHPMMLEDGLPGPPYCIADLHCDSQWRRMRLAGERPPIVTTT